MIVKPQKCVVVTGSNGFVGNSLSKELLDKGYIVFGTCFKSKNNINALDKHDFFSYRNVDLRSASSVNSFLDNKKIDCVFHTAARLPSKSSAPSSLFFEHNSKATEVLLKACLEHGIERFIMSSTIGVYGDEIVFERPLDEHHPLNPVTSYAKSKLLAEEHCDNYSKNSNLKICKLRYSGVYGNSRENGLVYNFTKYSLEDEDLLIIKDKIKDIIMVDEVVDANMRAYRLLDDIGNTTFNIGSGDPISVSELAKHIVRKTKSNSSIVFQSTKKLHSKMYYDIDKARQILKFNPNSTRKSVNKFIRQYEKAIISKKL